MWERGPHPEASLSPLEAGAQWLGLGKSSSFQTKSFIRSKLFYIKATEAKLSCKAGGSQAFSFTLPLLKPPPTQATPTNPVENRWLKPVVLKVWYQGGHSNTPRNLRDGHIFRPHPRPTDRRLWGRAQPSVSRSFQVILCTSLRSAKLTQEAFLEKKPFMMGLDERVEFI